jgi:hypothetical protein
VNNAVLTTYLNDHLAGSVAALELLDHLIDSHEEPDRAVLRELRNEISQDRQVLQRLLGDLGGKESLARKTAAWLTEKLGRAKLQVDDPGTGELRRLEALEALALGIQGKLSLWRALAVLERVPHLVSLDLAQLQARATGQFDRVEQLRLRVARSALAS